MPISSILVALGKIHDAELAALTVSRAMRAAEVPAGLRFSLSRRLEKEFWDVWPRMGLQAQVHFYGEREGFAGALEDSASHMLLLTGEYDFGPKWDQELLRRFAKTARRRTEPIRPKPICRVCPNGSRRKARRSSGGFRWWKAPRRPLRWWCAPG